MKKFNLYGLLDELDGQGNDLNGGGLDLSAREQEIIDAANGKEAKKDDDGEPVKLPSDDIKDDDNDDDKKDGFVDGKYADVDALKKGITELGSTLPEYVIEGMSDAALEQHYVELRKNFSAKKDDDENKSDVKDEDAKKIVEDAKLNWDDVSAEFGETGAISDETRKALNDANIPDMVIDGYIKGIQAEQTALTNEVYEIAGGQEQYDIIKAWVDEGGIPKAEVDALEGASKEVLMNAMYGFKARYDAAHPEDKKLLTGNVQRVTSDSYKNQAQYIADVTDRRYTTDKRYKQTVDDKFANSKSLQ